MKFILRSPSPINYTLPDGRTIDFKNEKYLIPEYLFSLAAVLFIFILNSKGEKRVKMI